MDYLSGPVEMKGAIFGVFAQHAAKLSPEMLAVIGGALAEASPVSSIVTTMEAIYAARDDVNPEWLTVGAQAAHLVIDTDYHGKAARADTLHQIFRRQLGERKTPDPKHDPDVDPRFAPPPAEETEE